MNLSPHFTLEELTFSQKAARLGIDNTPSPAVIAYLTKLCDLLLEPARVILETVAGHPVPLHVDSGYRSPDLNADVGGDPHSAHMEGRAADVIPIGMPLHQAFDALRSNGLPFDRIIIECNAWLHMAIPVDGAEPRRIAETAAGGPGRWTYELVA